MHYVVDRLEDITNKHEDSVFLLKEELDEFKRELIYNLGVNTRIRRNPENHEGTDECEDATE
tara:strand:- start:2610 stop:2795 length:186 start_codon:yes stop_codon:yes gene_type:complete